jgi:hypothetical protein
VGRRLLPLIDVANHSFCNNAAVTSGREEGGRLLYWYKRTCFTAGTKVQMLPLVDVSNRSFCINAAVTSVREGRSTGTRSVSTFRYFCTSKPLSRLALPVQTYKY